KAPMTAGLLSQPATGFTSLAGLPAVVLNKATDEGQPYYDLTDQNAYSGSDVIHLFTPDATVTVRAVKLVLRVPAGQPTADLTVRLETAAGALLQTATVTVSRASTSFAALIVNLAAAQALTSGTQYRLVFRSSTVASRPWSVAAIGTSGAAYTALTEGGTTD